jgi:hypothetical protein
MISALISLTLLVAFTLACASQVPAQLFGATTEYTPIIPCRVFDSRTGTPLPGGGITNIPISGDACGVPVGAVAAEINFTVVNPVAAGLLTVFLVNFVAGQTIANSTDIKLGVVPNVTQLIVGVSAQPLVTTHLVVDVYGLSPAGDIFTRRSARPTSRTPRPSRLSFASATAPCIWSSPGSATTASSITTRSLSPSGRISLSGVSWM